MVRMRYTLFKVRRSSRTNVLKDFFGKWYAGPIVIRHVQRVWCISAVYVHAAETQYCAFNKKTFWIHDGLGSSMEADMSMHIPWKSKAYLLNVF